jgi:hypothetical protein
VNTSTNVTLFYSTTGNWNNGINPWFAFLNLTSMGTSTPYWESYNPTNSGLSSFSFNPNACIYDPSRKLSYFLFSTLISIVQTPIRLSTNPTLQLSTLQQGISMVFAQNNLYVGTTVGLVYEVAWSLGGVPSISRLLIDATIILIPVNALVFDANTGVLFLGLDNGNIVKVGLDTFTIYSFIQASTNTGIRQMVLDNIGIVVTTSIIVYPSNLPQPPPANQPSTIMRYSLSNCGAFLDCNSCTTGDPYYCGWCVYNSKCISLNQNCNAGFIMPKLNNSTSCPANITITPSIATTNGGISIQVEGNYFTIAQNLTCWFNNTIQGNISIQNDTILFCKTPPVANVYAVVPFSLQTNGQLYVPSVPFTFQSCSNFTTCFSGCLTLSGCYWCLIDNICTGNSSLCSGSSNFTVGVGTSFVNQCPKITSITPLSEIQNDPINITIIGTEFFPGINCFINGVTVAGTYNSPTNISCAAITGPLGFLNVTLINNNTLFTQDILIFEFYGNK